MNTDEIVNMLKEAGINISLVILEGKAQEAYELGYNDPFVPTQGTVESIRSSIQIIMDRRKMELYQKNFEGVPDYEDRLEMKSYEFVESILHEIISTDEKDKIPERSISFRPIHEWIEKECAETGKDIIEKQLKEIFTQGCIDGHRDEVHKLLHRLRKNAEEKIFTEKMKIYKENYYDEPTEEALAKMKGYMFLEKMLHKIIIQYLDPPIVDGNQQNKPTNSYE